jgi:hypothetical protein
MTFEISSQECEKGNQVSQRTRNVSSTDFSTGQSPFIGQLLAKRGHFAAMDIATV